MRWGILAAAAVYLIGGSAEAAELYIFPDRGQAAVVDKATIVPLGSNKLVW